ncbi:MAG TPA: UbiA family prenyltransferase, partial [Pseudohongiella sp.]|nr:UbiA family prenyltransferase [Pseudohongiella sp.]
HQVSQVEQEFPASTPDLLQWFKLLRAHQWLKNLLIFVPLLASQQITNTTLWPGMLMAFLAFCLCASAVYITNDLFDLESDRLHPRKRLRPFASGVIPAWKGVTLIPPLLLAAVLLAVQVGSSFLSWLAVYFVLTCAYSFWLKKLVLADCVTLALLYTLRIVAGAAAADLDATFWLLAESVFLFLSLAFVKRYAELHMSEQSGVDRAHGRGYYTSHARMIQVLGMTSGGIAVLVLMFYFSREAVIGLYRSPSLLWVAIPFLLLWISWMWLQARRGNMHDDPLVFAVKDKTSLLAGLGFAVSLTLAATGVPW